MADLPDYRYSLKSYAQSVADSFQIPQTVFEGVLNANPYVGSTAILDTAEKLTGLYEKHQRWDFAVMEYGGVDPANPGTMTRRNNLETGMLAAGRGEEIAPTTLVIEGKGFVDFLKEIWEKPGQIWQDAKTLFWVTGLIVALVLMGLYVLIVRGDTK